MERKESHMLWNNLMEHMIEDHCPVCSIMKERTHSAMDNFLYECANLPDIRLKIKKEGGFCERHSKELLLLGDPLAHAIIYQDLFDEALKNLDSSKIKIGFFNKKEENQCFFCTREKKGEEHYTKAMAEAVSDQAFLEKYKESGMLCLPHLKMALSIKTRNPEKVQQMKEATLKKYNSMLESLKEIMRKHDFHFKNEPLTEKEKEDWKKAVSIFHGLEKDATT